jgi:hypothetical protein
MVRHAEPDRELDDVRAAVIDEVRRAAAVAEGGLASFNLVVSRFNNKEKLVEAAKAADDARRQMVAAVKQARVAWKQVVSELQQHAAAQHGDRRATHEEMHRLQRELREDIRRRQHELRRQQAEVRRAQQPRRGRTS